MARTDFGLQIQRVLLDQDLTQVELSKRLRVPPSYLSAVIHGQKIATVPFVERVGAALGLDRITVDRWHVIALEASKARLCKSYWARVVDFRASEGVV